jgi:hypothetical protein
MATFEYDVIYNQKEVAKGLTEDVVGALDKFAGKSKISRAGDRTGWEANYRIEVGARVLFGVRKGLPGKVEGTEFAKMQFAGDEKAILAAKQYLLNSVGGLELR